MTNGDTVRAFEYNFAEHVGARYAIALCNGTATLHTALMTLDGDWYTVTVPPLTMSSTSLAVVHAGGDPLWQDVDPATWIIHQPIEEPAIVVALYGLWSPEWRGQQTIIDAAQTLMPHQDGVAFTSYSFQASKILSLGEGGMLTTNDEGLAQAAREFSSLGYKMAADQPRIDPSAIKTPDCVRHHRLGWNYRMAEPVAAEGLRKLKCVNELTANRIIAADLYQRAIDLVPLIQPQYVPQGWYHDYWTFAVAVDTPEHRQQLSDAVVEHGGERPYTAWRLGYQEPALESTPLPRCPVAESLQPRLLQFQTNDLAAAERNAKALRRAIKALR